MIIGICGKSGCGKSTLSRMFLDRYSNAVHLEIDKVGHYVLTLPEVQEELVKAFGIEVLNEGKVDRGKIAEIDANSILPTKQIISNAILEIKNWHDALESILNGSNRIMLYNVVNNLSMMNYIVLANFCGIADFCKNINNSRILRRFVNFQSQTEQLSRGCISFETYLSEVANHKAYIESMYNIYTDFDLAEENFLTFMLLFDIRKNRNRNYCCFAFYSIHKKTLSSHLGLECQS